MQKAAVCLHFASNLFLFFLFELSPNFKTGHAFCYLHLFYSKTFSCLVSFNESVSSALSGRSVFSALPFFAKFKKTREKKEKKTQFGPHHIWPSLSPLLVLWLFPLIIDPGTLGALVPPVFLPNTQCGAVVMIWIQSACGKDLTCVCPDKNATGWSTDITRWTQGDWDCSRLL